MSATQVRPRIAADPRDILFRRLSAFASLSLADCGIIRGLPLKTEVHEAGSELIAEGAVPQRSRVLVAGWACRQRLLPDGRRQIFNFILPGDGVGFCSGQRTPAPTTIVAVTSVELIDASPLREAANDRRTYPGLALAIAAAERAEEALLLAQIVRLGRQTAYERMAHFLLETRDRLALVGLGDQLRFPLPLIQETLADALGLSIVHINRTLQQLRRDGLIELRASTAMLRRPEQLTATADYRPVSDGGLRQAI